MSDNNSLSVQERFGPNGTCFGCGPKNEKGLQIRSFWEGDELILEFTPEDHHNAFPGVINGGIIGALFDCHQNWAVATKLYEQDDIDEFPSTVTSTFTVNLKRPTPAKKELLVKARIIEIRGNIVDTEAEMIVDNKITATSTGTFAAVPKGHPAYHRWS